MEIYGKSFKSYTSKFGIYMNLCLQKKICLAELAGNFHIKASSFCSSPLMMAFQWKK